jgi:O-antigen/teichoic acid export membrane protein
MGLLVLWFYVFRETGLSCDFSILKKIFRFGIPLIGASLAFFIIHFSDRFFLSYFTGLDEVGIYSLGYKFGFLITFLVGEPFGRAWNVKLFEYAKNEGWQLRFASVFLFFFLALFITWAGVAFFSHDIIKVIANQQFQGAALVIPGVALGYLFREAGDFFKNILFINKKSGLVSKISISCATINLLLNYGLIQICGMIGAVLSTVATWLTYSLLLFYFSQRTHHIPYRPYPFIMVGLFGGLLYTLVLCFPLEYLPASIGLHLLLYAPILIVCSIIALNEYRSFQYNA